MKKVVPLYEEFINEAKSFKIKITDSSLKEGSVYFQKLQREIEKAYLDIDVFYDPTQKTLSIEGDNKSLSLKRGDEWGIYINVTDGTAEWTVFGGHDADTEIGSDTAVDVFTFKDVEKLINIIKKRY